MWGLALHHLSEGNFTALQDALGGPEGFDLQIVDWYESGKFADEPEMLAEALSCACMLGRTATAKYLLDKGVDPYAGMKTWLAGPHYAASSGHLETIKMLIEKGVPLEVQNGYGGTVFEQAIWSAVNEYRPSHAAIVEALVEAGAVVDDGYIEWWGEQNVADAETKARIANVLLRHAELHKKIAQAKEEVASVEQSSPSRELADALKALGNLLRRPPFLRTAANEAYSRAAAIYRDIGLPLEEAWVKRHIGINHEYAEQLEDAEAFYDEALSLYREHSTVDDLDYSNTVRYPAVVKNRLGKRSEAVQLWEEAHDRYQNIGPGGLVEGVAESAAWLTIFALEANDRQLANIWFAKASKASAASTDPDTHKFIADVRKRLEENNA